MNDDQRDADTQGRVVTPEAVLLDFEIAGLGSRIAALWLDYLIRIIGIILITVAGAVLEGATGSFFPSWVGVTVLILALFGVIFVYPLVFETLYGRTPGKMALGLRVVTTEGAPIDFRQAFIRAATSLFEIFATSGVVAAISMVATKRSQRLGDLAAGTMVLRQRRGEKNPEARSFAPPIGAEDYALSLDVSRLSSDEYAMVRSFLVRASGLSDKSRHEIGSGIATQMVARLSTTPPDGLSAEGFLNCVAAAYQLRFSNSR